MKHVGVIVGNYSTAFAELQTWLRGGSSLEWQHFAVAMSPQGATIYHAKKALDLADITLVVPLAPVCEMLSESVDDPNFYQYSLFELQAVRK